MDTCVARGGTVILLAMLTNLPGWLMAGLCFLALFGIPAFALLATVIRRRMNERPRDKAKRKPPGPVGGGAATGV